VLELALTGAPAQPDADEYEDDEPVEDAEPRFAAVSGGSPDQPPGAPPPPEDPQPPEPAPDAGLPPTAEPAGQPPADPGFAPPPPPPPPAPATGGPLATQPGQAMQTRDSIVEWLLSAFVPFYNLYWFYRSNKEMQAWSGGRIAFDATSSLLALTVGWIVIVPPFIAWSSYMGRIREAQRMAGLPQTASFWGSVGRAFLFSYNIKWHQDQFNEIAVREPQA
jgi:hypothetical protein